MPVLAQILFWAGLLPLLHAYLLYPWLMARLAKGRGQKPPPTFDPATPPHVSVLMAVYNEEKVLPAKLQSLFALDYPADRLRLFIGSDCSTDATNDILRAAAASAPHLHIALYTQRQGKPGIINQLARAAAEHCPVGPAHLFLITDASVLPAPNLVRRLARHFPPDPHLAIVDAHLRHTGMQDEGISKAENLYIGREVRLKHHEGRAWGTMIGPFGGCYAIRSSFYREVPSNFLVDDFYIAMRAFEQGGRAISDLDALCHEAVSHELREEYRRKVRISTGNFQNLHTFTHLWWPPTRRLAFAFFSHKVLRWLGPLWLALLGLGTLGLVAAGHTAYWALLALAVVPLADWPLSRMGLHWPPARGGRYFLMMNMALLKGFFQFLKGVKNNVWEPPKRG